MIDYSKYQIIERTLEALSLAVHPQDRTARNLAPFGEIRIALESVPRGAVKNPSGYFMYLTLEDGDYAVAVNADYYIGKQFTVTLPDHGLPPGGQTDLDDEVKLIELNGALLAEVRLIPNVNYPFPSGATLVRGQVEDGSGNPVPGSTLNVLGTEADPPGLDISFQTDARAQFVLFCNRLTRTLVKEINSKSYEAGRTLFLQAFHPDFGHSDKVEVDIIDGKTVYQKVVF